MHVTHKSIGFVISLAKEVNFAIPVPFLFRSIIGYQLRRMCCIARNAVCADCMFNASCIYGMAFESVIPKDNSVLAGRNRISHPVIIDCDDFTGELKTLVLNLVFLGATISHFPYFYYALKKGGAVTLDTPLRYMVQGVEARSIVESEFARCLNRRAQVLCSQYGHNDHDGGYGFSGDWAVTEQDIGWRRFRHYSARQGKVMWLGRMCGSFVLSGRFSSYECGLLRFAQLFHGGKNTGLGLGKLKVSEHGRI
ncbi:MAG: hypothetical protein FWB78_07620 [Treponema sp.]|nr:hypothetical protein [Treponema sp.]